MKNDKNKSYWFKRRRYGYGWVPTTWQGWVAIALFLAVVIGGLFFLRDVPRNELTIEVAVYLALVIASAVLLLATSNWKGPSPKWRWGKREDDEEGEDY